MKRIRGKKIVSVIMSVAMIASIMPGTVSSNALAATAGDDASLTWSSEQILGAAGGDEGLTLCGDGWSNNEATDEKYFEDGFSAVGDNAKAGGAKASTEGKTAAGTIPDAGSYVKYDASINGTFNLYTKISKGKTFYIVDSDGKAVSKTNTTDASTFDIVSVSAEAGKTYYCYAGGSSAQIWKATFNADSASMSASDLLATSSEKSTNGFALCGDGWNNNNATDDKTFEDGFSAIGDNAKAGSTKAKTGGVNAAGTVPDEGCYATYKAYTKGSLDVYTKIGNGKTFYIVGSDGSKAEKTNTTGSSTFDIVSIDVNPGNTYYAYLGAGTAQIWKMEYNVPKTEEETQTPWADVKAPVLGTVTADEDGNLIVPITAQIDKLTGADYVVVTMYKDGKEVSSQTLKAAKESVLFTPYESGNYSFKALAIRTGNAYKSSNEVKYDNYVLAVKKPVIVASDNRGNGKYYVDWFNLSDADKYVLKYRPHTTDASAEYKSINCTESEYEISGLSEGEYDIVIEAVRSSDGFVSKYTSTFTVTKEAQKQWYVVTVGSAQENKAVITSADGTKTAYDMSSRDTSAEKKNFEKAPSIANTTGTIEFPAIDSGKISNGEGGYQYYCTSIDPDTENFKLSAKFTVGDVKDSDNQTGFGVIGVDTLGINYFGAPDYYHKFFNEVSAIVYKKNPVLRVVQCYSNPDTSDNTDVSAVEEVMSIKDTGATYETGAVYDITLEKTDDKYIATCNGKVVEKGDTSMLSIQEDGSMWVGLMCARKNGVTVSDVKFETSDSNGITSSSADGRTKPSDAIYSTETSGSKDYEFIHSATVDGKLVVKFNGEEIFNKDVAQDAVTRIPTQLNDGENKFETIFVPSGTLDTLTSVEPIEKTKNVTYKELKYNTIFVSPDASAEGTGTYNDPMPISEAVKYVSKGQTIVLKNGTYNDGFYVARSICGTKDEMITITAEEYGKVIIDGGCVTIEGSYIHLYGLDIMNSSSKGIYLSGNDNIIEMCLTHACGNSGLQVSRTANANNEQGVKGRLWPSDNLIKNCESYDNCDDKRNDADGFAAKLTCGSGNKFYGCIAHHNIDDGWDLFSKPESGPIGQVIIENCVTYSNGWLTTDDVTAEGYNYGEGNGFKLGGGNIGVPHKLINSIAFANKAKGIASNSNFDCIIENCTSYGNASIVTTDSKGKPVYAYNVGLNKRTGDPTGWKLSGLISMANSETAVYEDMIPVSLYSASNYIYNGKDSYNSEGVMAVDDWFVSVDTTIIPTRNEDGSINMHGLLQLKEIAPADSGARLDITSENALSTLPEFTKESQEIVDNTTEETEANTESETASQTDKADVKDSPDTGDASPIMLLVLLMMISGSAVVLQQKKKRKF